MVLALTPAENRRQRQQQKAWREAIPENKKHITISTAVGSSTGKEFGCGTLNIEIILTRKRESVTAFVASQSLASLTRQS